MHTREFPVLDEIDEPLVSRLAVGLGDDAARVLAYLLVREGYGEPSEDMEPATRLAVRVGTELNRETVATALARLDDRDLLATTTLHTNARGRPPKAWRPIAPESGTIERVDAAQGERLVAQAVNVATAIGIERCEARSVSNHASETRTGDASEQGDDEETPPATGRADGERLRSAAGNERATDDQAVSDRVTGGRSSARNGGNESIKLGLNWEPNGLHAPFFAARAAGHYAHDGLSVSIDANRGSGAAIASVASGESDVALAGAATIVRARCEGISVVPLALLFQRAMATLYTTREAFAGRFERVDQLRGKRIGTSSASETGLLGRLFCSQAGVLDDVTLVDIAGEERAALEEGRADVVTGSFADPRQLENEGKTVDALVVADQFPMYGPALVTTETVLETRRSLLERFLAGTTAGWAEAIEKPAEAVRAIDGRDGLGLDGSGEDGEPGGRALRRERRTFEQAVREFGVSASVTDHGWGWQDETGWTRLETALAQVDLV